MPAPIRSASRALLPLFTVASLPALPSVVQHPLRAPGRALAAIAVAAGVAVTSAAHAQTTDAPTLPDSWKSAWEAPEPWRTDRFYLQTSVYTVHFNSDPNHDNTQRLIYGEWRMPYYALGGQWFLGASWFDNSFGQPSQFFFGGLLWRPIEKAQEFYIKLAAGALHGYTGEFQDKVPYNHDGWAPGIVPGVGYCYNRICGEMIMFGTAGILWTAGMTVP